MIVWRAEIEAGLCFGRSSYHDSVQMIVCVCVCVCVCVKHVYTAVLLETFWLNRK